MHRWQVIALVSIQVVWDIFYSLVYFPASFSEIFIQLIVFFIIYIVVLVFMAIPSPRHNRRNYFLTLAIEELHDEYSKTFKEYPEGGLIVQMIDKETEEDDFMMGRFTERFLENEDIDSFIRFLDQSQEVEIVHSNKLMNEFLYKNEDFKVDTICLLGDDLGTRTTNTRQSFEDKSELAPSRMEEKIFTVYNFKKD